VLKRRTRGRAKRPRRCARTTAMADEYFSASRADWCALCKCFIQPHGNAKRMHEQSEKHKKNVERKLKDIKHKTIAEAKEADKMKKTLAEIEAKAAQAYAADLVAEGRLTEAAAVRPQPKGAGARLREQEANAKRELEEAIERELHAREEAEYRATQTLGAWKFDDRSSYYWHAKSACYFDPKTRLYFNNGTKAWSKTAPQGAPPPPSVNSSTTTPGSQSEQYALGPYARGTVNLAAPAPAQKQSTYPTPTAAYAIAAAKSIQRSTASDKPAPSSSAGGEKNKSVSTSAFNLGYGTNHPKFEAAKARTQAGAIRTLAATGGQTFDAKLGGGLGYTTTSTTSDVSRKRPAVALNKKVDKAELEALKRREAARARVEARTKKSFGLG
jgi:WW domain-binding protein 4